MSDMRRGPEGPDWPTFKDIAEIYDYMEEINYARRTSENELKFLSVLAIFVSIVAVALVLMLH